jgi:hypothetical protein
MGARISTGKNNKQDYKTPDDLMEAVVRRFGPIAFDLAAHAGNTRSPNYFAPSTGPEGPLPLDPKAYGMDAFDHPWARLSCDTFLDREHTVEIDRRFPKDARVLSPNPPPGRYFLGEEDPDPDEFYHLRVGVLVRRPRKGLLWLNCEFGDIPRWATRTRQEAQEGAHVLLLTPASVGSVWFDTLVADRADCYYLRPRIPFIPGEPYNKDCMLSHFIPVRDRAGRPPMACTWNWKTDEITHTWHLSTDEIRAGK